MLDIKPIYRHKLELSKDHDSPQDLKIYTCFLCGMVITDTENATVEEFVNRYFVYVGHHDQDQRSTA